MKLELEHSFIKRFNGRTPRQQKLIASLLDAVDDAVENGWSKNGQVDLLSTCDSRYRQRVSEVLVFHILKHYELFPQLTNSGPDFLLNVNGSKIWIELVTPSPKGLPREWTEGADCEVCDVPNREILFRWTQAIDEKIKKLYGRMNQKTKKFEAGYVERGIVGPNDIYIIAVNGRDLRAGGLLDCFPNLDGISQYPFAVEAAFGIGPIQINIDRNTLRSVGSEWQSRKAVFKQSGSPVSVVPFLGNEFPLISGIWAMDIDERVLLENRKPMVFVHNPNAVNATSENLIPAEKEFFAKVCNVRLEVIRKSGRCC